MVACASICNYLQGACAANLPYLRLQARLHVSRDAMAEAAGQSSLLSSGDDASSQALLEMQLQTRKGSSPRLVAYFKEQD